MNSVPATPPRRRSRWLGALSATVLVGAILLGAPAASAADGGALVGAGSGRCLDVTGASQAAGTAVEIWDCHGDANLRVYNEAMCLAAHDNQTAAGTKAEIGTCTGGQNQKWWLDGDGAITRRPTAPRSCNGPPPAAPTSSGS